MNSVIKHLEIQVRYGYMFCRIQKINLTFVNSKGVTKHLVIQVH